VSLNNYGGARKAVEYLFTIGRKNIGLNAGPLDWLESLAAKTRLGRRFKRTWDLSLLPIMGGRDWLAESGESGFINYVKVIRKWMLFLSAMIPCIGRDALRNTHGLRNTHRISL
jgi:DNA-binding LacI/PurR family transcriptional regulator